MARMSRGLTGALFWFQLFELGLILPLFLMIAVLAVILGQFGEAKKVLTSLADEIRFTFWMAGL